MADQSERALEAVELARSTGKIKKGSNEVTKMLERGRAKLVVYANDVSPQEIIMHLPILSKEKNVPCFAANSKEELGAAAGLTVPTAAVVIVEEGNAKSLIKQLSEKVE